jgi:hypothetical protein
MDAEHALIDLGATPARRAALFDELRALSDVTPAPSRVETAAAPRHDDRFEQLLGELRGIGAGAG